MRLVIAGMLISAVLAGCSKNSTTEKDNVLPVITLNTPTDSQVYAAGQSIIMAGTITDNNIIAEVHIHVFNNDTGVKIMDVHLYPGSGSLTFNESFTASAGTNYKIQVLATDRSVNQATASVIVSCN